MRRSLACVFAILAMLASLFVVPMSSRGAVSFATPTGGFADSIRFFEQTNQSQALLDLQSGAMDLYTFPLRTSTDIAEAHSNPALRTIDNYGAEDDLFVNPVPVNQTLSPGVFNPFAIPDVRRALNFLIDRDYINAQIFAGYGFAHTAMWNQASPETARDPFFFHDLNQQYAYNYTRGRDMVFTALNASGAVYNGTWTWQGNPIVVNIVQRTEDQRFQIGQYVASQIQSLGLQANLIPRTGGAAFAIVYFGPPDTGAWMLYTEGWSTAWMLAWADGDLDFFNNGGEGSTIWSAVGGPYSPDPELSDIAVRLRDRTYASVEARQALIERGTTLAVNESVRVWLVATETFAYSNRISNVAYDLDGGLWSPFAVRTARFASPGGTLQVGQRLQFLSAWQPWQGFSSIYDLVVGNTFMDSGVAIHPHTGQYIPVRAAFDTTTAGPAGSLSVPTDAILYNPSTGAWESVAPGTTSHSKVTFNYTFGDWHDGPAVNMNDVLYDVALIARRAQGDVALHDSDALNIHDRLFASVFRGLRVLDADTLEVYVDYWHPDPSFIAATADVWPGTPWEVGELAMSTTLHDHTRVSQLTASIDALTQVDLATGPSIDYMDREIGSGNITTSGPGVTRPAGFAGLISQSEAEARWAALQSWRSFRTNYFPSNGPYYLDSADLVTRQAVLQNFLPYPFANDHWDALLTVPVPDLAIAPIADVVIGQPAHMNVTTDLAGQPYDSATVRYRITDPASGAILQTGQPSRTAPGTWQIDLDSAFTANLTAGTYRLEAAASSTEASITSFSNRTFNVTSGGADTTPPSSAVNALPSYWQTAGPFQLQVNASDAQSGIAFVDLYAAFNQAENNWSAASPVARDTSAPFAFAYSPYQGDGRYRFWSVATDTSGNTESLSGKPATGDVEAGLDGTIPTSVVDPIVGYWQSSSPLSLTATASDPTSGIGSVQLYVSYSPDGLAWSNPAAIGSDTTSPYTFSFAWTQGDGRYRFWSLARDNAGNNESLSSKPATGELQVGRDTAAPSATVVSLPGYWQATSTLSLQTTVTDATSGVTTVDLYASYSADGTTWSTPAKALTDTTSPFSFNYAAATDGRYRLWALATDAAGNAETLGSQVPSGEVGFGIDRIAPTASVVAFPSYWHRSGSFLVNVTASDAVSGAVSVGLYVSFSSDGITWSTPTLALTDSTAPFQFTFTPTQGDGRYRFWALATDAAGNAEALGSPPGNAEAEAGVDTVAPSIVSSTPSDGASGVAATTTPIRVAFSEGVNHPAAEAGFSITPSVSGAFSWDGNTLVFTPSTSLAAGTTYHVTIRASVMDSAGNPLATDYQISFATEAAAPPPGISGTVLAVSVVIGIAAVIAIALLLRRRASRKKR